MQKNIGKLIEDHRVTLGITQTQLGRKLGWDSGQFVSNIERGVSGLPVKKAKKACKLLHIKKKDLKEAIIEDFVARVSCALK